MANFLSVTLSLPKTPHGAIRTRGVDARHGTAGNGEAVLFELIWVGPGESEVQLEDIEYELTAASPGYNLSVLLPAGVRVPPPDQVVLVPKSSPTTYLTKDESDGRCVFVCEGVMPGVYKLAMVA